jgi:hypothetical protein
MEFKRTFNFNRGPIVFLVSPYIHLHSHSIRMQHKNSRGQFASALVTEIIKTDLGVIKSPRQSPPVN